MSDEPQPEPAPPTPPAHDPEATIPPTPKSSPPMPPPGPPIDFAMRAPKKPFTIPPYAGCLVKMVFGFGVLLVMGYCALIALNPKAQKWATQGAKDGSGGPTPFNALNQVLAIPAQAIGKTKDVVAASDARTGLVNGVVAEEEAKLKGKSGSAAYVVTDPFAAKTPAPAAGKAAPAGDGPAVISREALLAMAEKQAATTDTPATPPPAPIVVAPPKAAPPPTVVKLGGGIVIASASPEGAPVASQPFLFWVVGLNISGVFQNSPHRILMNNRLVYEGTEASSSLGITFDHLDLANKLIVFRDKTGAVVTRSY